MPIALEHINNKRVILLKILTEFGTAKQSELRCGTVIDRSYVNTLGTSVTVVGRKINTVITEKQCLKLSALHIREHSIASLRRIFGVTVIKPTLFFLLKAVVQNALVIGHKNSAFAVLTVEYVYEVIIGKVNPFDSLIGTVVNFHKPLNKIFGVSVALDFDRNIFREARINTLVARNLGLFGIKSRYLVKFSVLIHQARDK